jgi:CheY-like chemotaxis protein
MTDPADIQSKILFVDDDASFLQMIRDVFGGASDGAWEIHTATGGGDALQRLRSRRMDLAVIDVFMPVMDGLQLLRVLNEEFPSLPKVLLTGMPDGNTRAAALEGGAALFLEKPASAAGYQSVFATLNELLRWHQRFSAQGSLRRLDLLDLVKLECKSGNSRRFEVFAGDTRGEIYIKEGAIIHAIMPDRRGQSAFTFLTTTPGAVFYLREYVEPIERSVDRQWEFLVMEAAHVAAQLEEAAASSPSATSPEAAVSAPAVPVPALASHPAAPAGDAANVAPGSGIQAARAQGGFPQPHAHGNARDRAVEAGRATGITSLSGWRRPRGVQSGGTLVVRGVPGSAP